MELWHILSLILLTLATACFLTLRRRFDYWNERGVVHDKPVLFFGNLYEIGRKKPLFLPFREYYQKYKHVAPFAGFYLFLRRAVILLDLELIKNVLIKDFSNFARRGNYFNERDDPLSAHLFNLDGPQWRKMRAKLTPTFTSGKMRFMFPTIVEVAEHFVQIFEELLQQQKLNCEEDKLNIECRELLARFTTDVIGSCAFGLDCNSLNDAETQFRLMGKKAFQKRRHGTLIIAFITAFPKLGRKLGIKTVPQDVNDFFMGVVRDTVAYREREKVQRNDFLNLLIELKNNNETEGLSLEQIAAQAFVFFLAGFETSSSTMGFCLYEMAVNQQMQQKVRAEINEVFERHNNKFNYEGMKELKYLQQILHETLRKYSIGAIVVRQTKNDYPVPGSKHIIEQGTTVIIPIDAIHHDADIYPNPEVFDPERFQPDEVAKRHAMAWLPFGEGPRNCIGLRFGEMQAIIGLAFLLRHFKFEPSYLTSIPIEYDKKTFVLTSKGGINLKVTSLKIEPNNVQNVSNEE